MRFIRIFVRLSHLLGNKISLIFKSADKFICSKFKLSFSALTEDFAGF